MLQAKCKVVSLNLAHPVVRSALTLQVASVYLSVRLYWIYCG